MSKDKLLETARRWAIDISEYRKPWVASLYRTDKLEPLGEAKEILRFARSQVIKQAPNVKHPRVCIDVVEEGIVSGPQAGRRKVDFALFSISSFQINRRVGWVSSYNLQEEEGARELPRTLTSKSLIHFFFAQRGASKVWINLTFMLFTNSFYFGDELIF